MSKKARRARAKLKVTQQAISSGGISRPAPAKAMIEPKVLKTEVAATSLIQAAKYQYVLPELRRIGIIAGILFAILIALSFIVT